MHDALTMGIPVIAILFGILFNRSDVRRLEDKIDSRLDRLESKFDSRLIALETRMDSGFRKIGDQLIHFHNVTGRIGTIEKRQ